MPAGSLLGSLQSQVPDYVPLVPVSLDGSFSQASELRPMAPQVKTSSGANVVVDAYNVLSAPFGPKARVVFIQNQSTTPIKYALDDTVTSAAFHGVIAGGVAQDDGNGAKVQFEVERYGISRISLVNDSAGVRASVEVFTNEVI